MLEKGSELALASALDNANEEAAKYEKEKKDGKDKPKKKKEE